jgi:nicotinate phosphoribosyltransferase
LTAPPLGLLTDLYELTMACGFHRSEIGRCEAAFHLVFRKHPFDGGYAICAGLETAIDAVQRFRFDEADIRYLAGLKGNDGLPLFDADFLAALRGFRFTGNIDAVPEGTVVFAHEPLVRVTGPIVECQLLESVLLCIVNFQSLIATKATRVCAAAKGDPVIEFGLRRAHGVDGALSASRAAYIGGCAGTSNVMAGRRFDIPVMGTHAHSWVMAHGDERRAFREYAAALPNNCVFLVDTYDSLEGVRHAIIVGRELRERGHELAGIRLDSGDLAVLSIEARRLLDDAGFPDAKIVASNDLNEDLIASLKEQGSAVNVWGVGTKLVTAYDQPALGGVYKLTAIREPGGEWRPRIKLSEQTIKISNPGVQQVRRFRDEAGFLADVIYDVGLGIGPQESFAEFRDATLFRPFPENAASEDLLVPVFRDGELIYDAPPIHDVQQRTRSQLDQLAPATKRRLNPQPFPVGLEQTLFELKTRLVREARSIEA